jgi:2-succinyl-6-hydroxy-2,4-cyclohexadiene-1-carboxylate synthase
VTALVLLHGFTGSPASFDALLAELRPCRRRLSVFKPALLGHDASTLKLPVRRFEEEVDRLAGEIRATGFAGAYLCGYSLGARMALGLLARHPFMFRGASLIGVNPGLSNDAERARRIGVDERWCELLLRRGLRAFSAAWEAQPLFATQLGVDSKRREAQRRLREGHVSNGLVRSLRTVGLGQMPNYRGVLGMQPLPVHLVVGALDTKFERLARELLRASPRVVLDVIPDAGHNLLLEAPRQLARVLIKASEDRA